MDITTKSEILALIDQMPNGLANLPGEVFSTGSMSITPGDFYIAGLNPGFGTSYPTIRDHVSNWSLENYSAFLDQCWKEKCWNIDCYGLQVSARCYCKRGVEKHQVAVQKIIKRAKSGVNLRHVFATNAIFVKSDDANNFRLEYGISLKTAFDYCWPIHQYLLSKIRPKVILSLGFSEGASAFSFFGNKANKVGSIESHFVSGRKYPSFKWANMTFNLSVGEIDALVIGIRHPSYVPDATNTEVFTDLISARLTNS